MTTRHKILSYIVIFLTCVSTNANDAKNRFAGNIVPQPKIVEMATKSKLLKLLPDKITVIYGASSAKTKIGAEEIKKELTRKGFLSNVNITSDVNYRKGAEQFLIIIGGPKENKITRLQWKNVTHAKELLKLKPQGYLVEQIKINGKPAAILAGASPQGSLYAAVTFMQMLDKNGKDVIIPPVYIKDWPDFNWRYISHMTHIFSQSAKAYKFAGKRYIGAEKTGQEYIDWALRFKVNVVGIKIWQINKAMLSIQKYGSDRGIYPFMFYPRTSVSVGKVKDHKNDPKYKGLTHIWKRRKCYITWSRDDLLSPLYSEFAKACKKVNAKFCWFHTVDTGLSTLNYADWKNRDKLDKKKFGNNLGMAASHVINLIDSAFKKESPQTNIVYVTYPYSAAVLADDFPENLFPDIASAYAMREKLFIKKYFKAIRENTPKNLYTCLRETNRENVERWLNATKRPILAYFETSHRPGDNLCNSRPRFIKTFYSKQYDNIYFFPSVYVTFIHGIEVPVKVLLNAEYCWNVNQKGADYYKKFNFATDLTKPKVIFNDIVPRCCRAYWGPKAGKYFVPLFQAGITPGFIENPVKFQRSLRSSFVKALDAAGNLTYSKGSEIFFTGAIAQMRKQHAKLKKAIPPLNNWLNNYKAKTRDNFSYKYGTMFWLLANYWYYKSAVWIPALELQKHIVNGDKTKALNSLKQAEKALKNAKSKMKDAIAKISGKHLCLMPRLKVNGKRKILPQIMLGELDELGVILQGIATKTQHINKKLIIKKKEITKLKARQFVAGHTPDDAKSYNNFTVYSAKPQRKAFYQTAIKIYYDRKNIYIKAKMSDIKNKITVVGRNPGAKGNFWARGKEENDLEIFLAPPKHKFIYQFAFDPSGQKFQIRLFGKILKRDTEWQCDWKVKTRLEKGFWTATVTIPFSELGIKAPSKGDIWKFNLARQHVEKSGSIEFSTITPGAYPNKPATYSALVFK
jgi:Glycosyl hydrolase family 67 N-terminus